MGRKKERRKRLMPVEIRVANGTMTITCPVNGQGTPSSSGKSMVVATTNGFVLVDGSDLKVSLNVIKPRG